jgi:hypothetical protein
MFSISNVKNNQRVKIKSYYFLEHNLFCGSVSVVGIDPDYELDGPGIESRCGRDSPYLSRRALGPTQPTVQWVSDLSRG